MVVTISSKECSQSQSVELLRWNESGYTTESVYAGDETVSSGVFAGLSVSLREIFA
jgi:hypothetical protein